MKKIGNIFTNLLAVLLLAACNTTNTSSSSSLTSDESSSSLPVSISSSVQNQDRYTVTKEEWEAATKELNYTVEQIENGDSILVHKHTKDALEMDGTIIIFVEDKQYILESDETYGWIANDCTYVDFWHGSVLEGYNFNSFGYDEESKSYVNIVPSEDGWTYNVHFLNGIPVSTIFTKEFETGTYVVEKKYTNVGTTVIEIPEYIFDYEIEDPIVRTVDEDTWNSYKDLSNYTLDAYYLNSEGIQYNRTKITEDAMECDGNIYVNIDEKTYLLEEKDSSWYAKESDPVNVWKGFPTLLSEFDYNDFEFDATKKAYVSILENGKLICSVYFADGVFLSAIIERIEDLNDPNSVETFAYAVSDIGTTVVTVPEYIIEG